MKVNASDLVGISEEEIWKMANHRYDVVFADKEVENLSGKKIIISHYYWRLFREFPGCPVESKHAILDNYTSSTHLELGRIIFWDAHDKAAVKYNGIVNDMNKVFYEITNALFNMSYVRLSEYVTSASLHDLVAILHDKRVLKAKEDYHKVCIDSNYYQRNVEEAISKVHGVVKNVLYKNDGLLKNNGIKKLCAANIVSKGQMIQLIGPRGYVHDIDGRVFKVPIHVGYGEGLTTLYDSAIESRSAAKSLFMTTDPLEQSEYFNREMQLLCSIVHSISGDTCVGFKTIPWLVAEDDLYLLKGKNHMVDGQTVMIWDSIDEYVGKYIHLRSITACGNTDTQTVCRTCLGWAHNVVPPETNLGYTLGTILCAIISQLMLSTKHYQASLGAVLFTITKEQSKWIRCCRVDESKILLQRDIVKRNPIIRLDKRFVKNLNNILNVDITELSASRVTNCKSFGIVEGNDNGEPLGPFDELKTSISGQGISLSSEVLVYLKKHGWKTDSKSVEFQLKNWPADVPIFETPKLGDNIHLFLKEIKSFIMPTSVTERGITDFTSRGKAISELVMLLRKRSNFNIIQVEIFVRACMTVDGANKNYLLPNTNEDFTFMSAKMCLYHRSLTMLLAYEKQAAAIADVGWYKKAERVTHMLDPLIA